MTPLALLVTYAWLVYVPADSDARLAAIAGVDPDRAEMLANCRTAFEVLGHAMLEGENLPVYGRCFREAVNTHVLAIRWERQP